MWQHEFNLKLKNIFELTNVEREKKNWNIYQLITTSKKLANVWDFGHLWYIMFVLTQGKKILSYFRCLKDVVKLKHKDQFTY
jgi:hypothetical protein